MLLHSKLNFYFNFIVIDIIITKQKLKTEKTKVKKKT